MWREFSKPRLLISTVKRQVTDIMKIIKDQHANIFNVLKSIMIYLRADDNDNKNHYQSVLNRANKLPEVRFIMAYTL